MKSISSTISKLVALILGTETWLKYHNVRTGFHNPSYRFEHNEVAFVHIPKSGGTSFHKILSQDKESRFVNLGMHRPVSRFCKPQEFKYITIVRDPLERVWSYYQMVLGKPQGYPYKRYADMGLDCFLKHCWEVRNMACRYYSGYVKPEPTLKTLHIALNNLKEFLYVIEFENFQTDVEDFLEKLTIKVDHIPHERQRKYAPIQEIDRQLINEYNYLDVELFSELKKSTWFRKASENK